MAGGWKVREVKLAYEQRIRDTYLENARKVTGDVYIPLAIAISHLTKAYGEFRLHIDFDQLTSGLPSFLTRILLRPGWP
jgi:hypothetical protein